MADRTNGMEPANGVQLLLTGQIGPVEFHICTCCATTADMLRGECMNKTQAHINSHLHEQFSACEGHVHKYQTGGGNKLVSPLYFH